MTNVINLLQEKEGTCVMCGEKAEFLAEARYKSGTVMEPLCRKCKAIDNMIRASKD